MMSISKARSAGKEGEEEEGVGAWVGRGVPGREVCGHQQRRM
jgi:hypothetical protein